MLKRINGVRENDDDDDDDDRREKDWNNGIRGKERWKRRAKAWKRSEDTATAAAAAAGKSRQEIRGKG